MRNGMHASLSVGRSVVLVITIILANLATTVYALPSSSALPSSKASATSKPFPSKVVAWNSNPASTLTITTEPETPSIPSTRELLTFGLPTLGVWLLQPVLSLIDSLVIGRSKSLNSVAELAALGPGISWCDSTAYLFQFMGMATTILMNKGFVSNDPTELDRSVSHAIITSLVFGAILSVLQFSLSTQAVSALAGSSYEIIPLAVKYARIRSFGGIFAVPTIVAQSAFLATKDASTPLIAVLFGASFNIIGDIILVSYLNQGIGGAAIATFLAQAAGCLYLLVAGIIRIGKHKNISILRDFSKFKNMVTIPTIKDALQFLTFCGPLFFVLLVKTVLWSYTTYASSLSGTFNVAAHQIVLNFFLLCCVFGDVISQMSQTYLPPFLRAHLSKATKALTHSDGRNSLSVAIRRILNISLFVGTFNTLTGIYLSEVAPQVLAFLTVKLL